MIDFETFWIRDDRFSRLGRRPDLLTAGQLPANRSLMISDEQAHMLNLAFKGKYYLMGSTRTELRGRKRTRRVLVRDGLLAPAKYPNTPDQITGPGLAALSSWKAAQERKAS